MNVHEKELLQKFIKSTRLNYLFEVELTPNQNVFMLYPTNDLWLTEKQFQVLKKFVELLGEKNFCLTQFDGGTPFEGLYSATNEVYELNIQSTYEEYYSLNIHSISVLFSTKGSWVILIDETFEAGYGIIVTSKEFVEKFKILWKQIEPSNLELMDYQSYSKSVEYYEEILKNKGILR